MFPIKKKKCISNFQIKTNYGTYQLTKHTFKNSANANLAKFTIASFFILIHQNTEIIFEMNRNRLYSHLGSNKGRSSWKCLTWKIINCSLLSIIYAFQSRKECAGNVKNLKCQQRFTLGLLINTRFEHFNIKV